MQGKATIARHPIHPMLVSLPIGFFVGTFVCYLVYQVTHDVLWPTMAINLMMFGIGSALLAALFGFVDYLTAPMADRTKRTATSHMLLNLLVVAIFATALWQGWNDHGSNVSFALTIAGVVVMAFSGWLGGHLGYIDGVGAPEGVHPPEVLRT